jgi:hypothetical protein
MFFKVLTLVSLLQNYGYNITLMCSFYLFMWIY